jgi:hypothetical protein
MNALVRPILKLNVEVAAPVEIGPIAEGVRRYVPITGGVFGGDFSGRILPGADWQLIRSDGTLDIAAHYALETDLGERIEVVSTGLRAGPPDVLARLNKGEAVDPSLYYFRTAIRMRTGSERLRRLNMMLCYAKGERKASTVHLDVFEIL